MSVRDVVSIKGTRKGGGKQEKIEISGYRIKRGQKKRGRKEKIRRYEYVYHGRETEMTEVVL